MKFLGRDKRFKDWPAPPKRRPIKKSPKRLLAETFWGARDQKRFLRDMVWLVDRYMKPQPIFAGDNMLVIGRNLHFLGDERFQECFRSVVSPDNYVARAIMWRIHIYCWAAKNGLKREGDFVECGVASGALAAIMCAYLDFGQVDKKFYLVDAWDTDPRVDPSPYNGNAFSYVQSVFAPYPNVKLTPGFIPDVFTTAELPERIAFLHLDLNSAGAEISALDRLYKRLSPGAILLLDDFGHTAFSRTHQAQLEWFGWHGLHVAELPTGQGLVIA